MSGARHLYVHLPFCAHRCGYCDFVTLVGRHDQHEAYVDAVLGDTRWQAGSAHLFRLARAAGVPAILDGDRAPRKRPELLDLATHVAFSMQGLRDLVGLDDPRAALAALPPASAWIAVTNGSQGVFFREGGEIVHAPAFDVAAVDTLGAGDTWHGAFALALGEGLDERAAGRFASAAAAVKCTRFGGRDGAPIRAEVEAFLAACDTARVG